MAADSEFIEGVREAQIRELFSRIRVLELAVDDLANEIFVAGARERLSGADKNKCLLLLII